MSPIRRIQSYLAFFDPAEEGGYNVSFPDFPGCVTFGRTFEESQEKAEEVLGLWIEELRSQKKFVARKYERARAIIGEVRVAA